MYLADNTLRGECRMYLEEEDYETIEIIDWNNNTVKYMSACIFLYNYV